MPISQKRIRALVVDDSVAVVRSMCSVLAQQGEVEVVGTAQDGRDAVILAQILHPDLVVLDVQMPVMNGMEAALQLSRQCPGIRILMTTSHDSPRLRQACRDCGPQGFIPKERVHEEFGGVLHQLFGPIE